MKAGVRIFTTCVPPLAYGSSHPSIFQTIHNAHVLGLKTNINEEPLRVVEQRLTSIAKQEGFPIGAPQPYDHAVYKYQIPGGVISNTVAQLKALGIEDKLHEVLEDTAQIIVDLGHPIMITPHSQFIVSQAAINVATGKRYEELLDYMIEFALGIWGDEESGVPYMDQDVKDKFLSHPNAKVLAERWEKRQELAATTTVEEMRAAYGMTDASDEDFVLAWIMGGTEHIEAMRKAGPPKRYYTGQEPLVVLLNELKKHKDISRLQLRKGNSTFDFRQ
jgi:oxaloacetate decarboxylase alpha subunit